VKLYMVRHGQSENNLAKRFTGWAQVKLTEKGIADARRAGEYLKGISFDRIYSSDLIRAVQTAEYAIPGCRPVQLAQLREIGLGELEMRSIDECMEQLGEDFLINRSMYNFVPYGGENRDMIEARVRCFFEMLENDPCENVAVFAHAGTVNTALDIVMDTRLDRAHLACLNGSVAMFEHTNGRWILRTWGAAL